MPTTITLKIKDEQGNVTNQQHSIEDIDLGQFQELMSILKNIITELKNEDSLKEFISDVFGNDFNPDEADPEQLVKDMDMQFVTKAVNSFESLAVKMPEQAYKLLSILSGIELATIKKQKLLDALDIYDAIIEENDIERLVKRIKKSLGVTVAKVKFLNLVKKATQQ
jgi:predicted component of type VI protein secretion system